MLIANGWHPSPQPVKAPDWMLTWEPWSPRGAAPPWTSPRLRSSRTLSSCSTICMDGWRSSEYEWINSYESPYGVSGFSFFKRFSLLINLIWSFNVLLKCKIYVKLLFIFLISGSGLWQHWFAQKTTALIKKIHVDTALAVTNTGSFNLRF